MARIGILREHKRHIINVFLFDSILERLVRCRCAIIILAISVALAWNFQAAAISVSVRLGSMDIIVNIVR